MREFKVGDFVVVNSNEVPSNNESVGIRIGDVGIVREVWTNLVSRRNGVSVELSCFHTDLDLEELKLDGEFDELTMSYMFYESELRIATPEEIANNTILEGK